jgi:hypothetical protein
MITTSTIDAHRIPAMAEGISAVLDRIKGDGSVPNGYDVLRWFLKGWLVHKDPAVQKDLALFAFAHDFEGKIVPEASMKGYAVLRAAVEGDLLLQPNVFAPKGDD